MLLRAIVSFFIGFMIFLIGSMDNPMRGEVSVSPDNYQLVYDTLMVWDYQTKVSGYGGVC